MCPRAIALGQPVQPDKEVMATLEAHDHLAEKMKIHFSILSAILLVYVLLLNKFANKLTMKTHRILFSLYLLFYFYSLVLLFNTAHQGAKLVHYHGITTSLYTSTKLPVNK